MLTQPGDTDHTVTVSRCASGLCRWDCTCTSHSDIQMMPGHARWEAKDHVDKNHGVLVAPEGL